MKRGGLAMTPYRRLADLPQVIPIFPLDGDFDWKPQPTLT